MSDQVPFPIPGDDEPEPADNAPTPTPAETSPSGRKKRSDTGQRRTTGPTPAKLKAQTAAEGVSELVSMAGTVLSPITPLGGAYLLASSEKAQDVAAALAEVEPRVLKALMKAKKATVYVELGSLALGFVAAVMIERDLLPEVAAEIPFGPADVRLGLLHSELMSKGVYDSWVPRERVDDGTGDATSAGAWGGTPPVLARR